MNDILRANLLSPIVLAFALGIVTKLIKSEFSLPKDLYASLGIYLLFALGIKGGVELSHSSYDAIAMPAAVTLFIGCLTPITAYLTLRHLGRFSTTDSAAVAAHYGSVSAVTFIAAQQFVQRMGAPAEGFMPTLLTLLESPGIHIALGIGAVQRMKQLQASAAMVGVTSGGAAVLGGGPGNLAVAGDAPPAVGSLKQVLHEVLTARTMVLLVGGLIIGFLMGEKGWEQIKPFYDGGFRGALTLFILEMGIIAGARLGDLKKVGPFLLGFGMLMPVVHGALGAALGSWAGLSVGGAT
nr:sodium-dependent bicarbonate transport family permease [Gemmatimonadaceae bacterium]